MAQNLFKTRYLPNLDGSESSIAMTNTNTVFIHTYLGDDNTGDGTRQKPYRSMAKALLKTSVIYILFRGLINEYFNSSRTIIGDDINQTIVTSNYVPNHGTLYNLTIDTARPYQDASTFFGGRVIINNGSVSVRASTGNGTTNSYTLFLKNIDSLTSVTPSGWIYTNVYAASTIKQHINSFKNSITNIIRYYSSIEAIYSYNVYRVTVRVYSYTSSSLMSISPNYTNDSVANVELLRNAMIFFGIPSASIANLTSKDSFNNETCKIVKEQSTGGTSQNIFNRYTDNKTGTLQSVITATAKTSIRLINLSTPAANWPTSGDIYLPTELDLTANGITLAKGWNGSSVIDSGHSEIFSYSSVTINSTNDITLNGSSYTFKSAHNSLTKLCTRFGDIVDFSLNPNPESEALWSSETGGYVGPMRPAYDNIQANMTSIVSVDEATGVDTATAGDLIQLNSSGEFVFNALSTQTWNRFRDSVTKYIPQGSAFKGGGGNSTDGSPFGYYIGKKQNLIGTTKYYAGDALTVGKWYKVFNDSAISVSNAIIYNSVQYLPEYTFCCVTGVTVFSLLNAGTGTYVCEIIADVMESIEIMPYDDMTTESAFPKFSCPINGDCKLLYYTAAGATRYGKTAGNPVLFSDLALANMITDFGNISNKIAYYDNWAISNADQEFFVLGDPSLTSPKSTYFTTAIPTIRYFKRSINAHFDKPYDY